MRAEVFPSGGYEIMSIIVPKRIALAFLFLCSIVLNTLLLGCSISRPAGSVAPGPPPKALTANPTLVATPSLVPHTGLWISPDLPQSLLNVVEGEALAEYGFNLVENPDQAQVILEPGGGGTLGAWVYALVAPFPTLTDGLSWVTLQSLWSGEESGQRILVGRQSIRALERILGPRGGNVLVGPEDRLVDITWTLGAYAIVPFEALEPRWKVLALDGHAPIHRGFDLQVYPLKVGISVEGPEAASERLVEALQGKQSNYDPEKMTVLVMTGVTALTRATAWQMDRQGVAFPAEKIGDWLVEADLTHISNEAAFTPDCPPPDPAQAGLRFCSDPEHIELLEIVSTDIIELTGNHVQDYGSEALAFTIDEYKARGWGIFGGGKTLEDSFQPYLIEHNGNKLAFLGCNQAGPKFAWATEERPGSTPCEFDRLVQEIERLAEQGFLVLFNFQWGESSVIIKDQQTAFKSMVDAGAVIVSGSQAHQPMGMAFHEDGFVHYGLGNLFFDQMQTLAMRSELIDRHVFYEGRYISTELLTAMLESYAQPRPMTEQERTALLGRIFKESGW